MNTTASRIPRLAAAGWIAAAALLPLPGHAQDYGAMVQQQMNAMNANIARGQQMVNGMVQQRMADPQVRAAYDRYLAQVRAAGRPPMDYPTFTYSYIYTNGFSAQGIAHVRANEAGIANAERAALQRLRDAGAQRGAAQQAQRDGYFANQQEAGRQLLGQSSYVAPNGATLALPHTWPRNSTHQYQGQTYHVDASGQYFVLGADHWWVPLQPR